MNGGKKGRLTFTYGAIQFFFWFGYGTALAFASPYLLACGLSNTAIGLISAAACGVTVLLQPALSSYADRAESPSIKTFLMIAACAMAVFGVLLALSYGKSGPLNGLLLGCAILNGQQHGSDLVGCEAASVATLAAIQKINPDIIINSGMNNVALDIMKLKISQLLHPPIEEH